MPFEGVSEESAPPPGAALSNDSEASGPFLCSAEHRRSQSRFQVPCLPGALLRFDGQLPQENLVAVLRAELHHDPTQSLTIGGVDDGGAGSVLAVTPSREL